MILVGGTPMPRIIRVPVGGLDRRFICRSQRPLAGRLAGDHRLLIAMVFQAGFVIEFDFIDLAHERAVVVRGVRGTMFILVGGFGDEFSVACRGARFLGSDGRCGDRCVGRCGRLVLQVPYGFAQWCAQQGRNLILVEELTGPRPAGRPRAPWGGAEHLSGRERR
jgi:hypothetical protein